MKGKFLSAKWKIPVCLMLIAFGTFIAVRFGLWGVDALKTGDGVATAVFCFGFAVFGFLLGCLSIVVFNHNRGAYLEADENGLRARIGFGEEISIKAEEIIAVETYGISLSVYTESKIYIIGGLVNAFEIENYILATAKPRNFLADAEKIQANYVGYKKKFAGFLVVACVFAILLFANIALCAWLTGGRDLAEFTARDEFVFCVFAAVEVVTLVFAFFFADKAGRYNLMHKHCKTHMSALLVYEYRQKRIPAHAADVLYFHDFSYRVVIFLGGGRFAYMLEKYDAEDNSWIACYDKARTFESEKELYDDISTRFCGTILERIE